jgi:hypothetical protein
MKLERGIERVAGRKEEQDVTLERCYSSLDQEYDFRLEE